MAATWSDRHPDEQEPIDTPAAYLVRTLANDPAMRAALKETCPYKEWCRTPERCAGKSRCQNDPCCGD